MILGLKLSLKTSVLLLLLVLTLALPLPSVKRGSHFEIATAAQAKNANYRSPFLRGKLQLGNSASVSKLYGKVQIQKSAPQRVAQGTQLAILEDTQCSGNAYFRAADGKPLLKVEVKPYILDKDYEYEELLREFNSNPCVLGVSENFKVQIAAAKSSSFHEDLHYEELDHLKDLELESAEKLFWESSAKIRKKVVVAIVDTGIDYNHEDLKDRMWQGPAGERGANFVTPDSEDPMDDNGHGTHCAGLVGATGSNQLGITGVMAFQTELMAVKTMDSEGSGDLFAIASGIRFAVDQGADVINISITAPTESPLMEDALEYAVSQGAVVLVAAGNQSEEISEENFYSPIGYASSIPGVLGVGSYDALLKFKSGFSNYSRSFVEMSAPGSAGAHKILSTWPGDSYERAHGTSMASPMVAGAAALVVGFLKSIERDYSASEVERILLDSSFQDSRLEDYVAKGRKLNLRLLSRYLQNTYLFEGSGGFEDLE